MLDLSFFRFFFLPLFSPFFIFSFSVCVIDFVVLMFSVGPGFVRGSVAKAAV